MIGLKKIDVFILKKFFMLFLGCFFICLFVFMMQMVWKHIENMVGKGLGLDILGEFFLYMAMTLVPVALPMSILLTSLLTFGNMGEQLELTAMKAAGIPLLRIMRPLIVCATLLMGVSFCFQNYISPKAQMEMARMLFSMKSTSPALEIPEGVFYNGIPNVNLYVEHKNAETGMLYGVIIYKLDNGIDNMQIVVADSAKLETTADKHFLKLSMFDGEQFENLQSSSSGLLSNTQVPYDRETFQYKTLLIDFDTDFDLMNAEELKNLADAKPLSKLTADADSMIAVYDSVGRANYAELAPRYLQTGHLSRTDSALATHIAQTANIDTLHKNLSQNKRLRVLQSASSSVGGMLVELDWRTSVSHYGYAMVRRHDIKWHEKFTSALACLFFFFIGAPLGAIIRKGGLGVSTIVSVLIFIIYYIIGVSGMKMARDDNWNITYGMWISTLVMTPLGIFFTYKSNRDATLLNIDYYGTLVKKLFGYRPKRAYTKKEIVIDEPDYALATQQLNDITAQLADLSAHLRLNRLPNYLTTFFKPRQANELLPIMEQLEQIIVMLSNSSERKLIYCLNNYPISYLNAHISPSRHSWINKLMGVVLPIGLLIWLRMVIFRQKLRKDINQIIQTNNQIITRIEKIQI